MEMKQCDNCIHKHVCSRTPMIISGGQCMQYKASDLMLELPVPIGGTVYEIDPYGEIYEHTLKKVIYDTPEVAFSDVSIGKRIFTTREAAEDAIEEQSHESGYL